MSTEEWAAESIHSCTCADPTDVIESLIENAERGNSSNNHAHTLHEEEFSLRNLLVWSGCYLQLPKLKTYRIWKISGCNNRQASCPARNTTL